MSVFYTDVSSRKNQILLRGYDNGRRFEEAIDYSPYLFVKSPNKSSKFRTLAGQPAERIDFASMSDARAFMERYKDVDGFEIYGTTNWAYQYINDTFKGDIEFDQSKISTVILDIETDSTGGFPDIDLANKAVTAITLRKDGRSVTFGTKYYKPKEATHAYVLCEEENELLERFLDYWQSPQWAPDIVTGWNIEFFDVPYLVNRITLILGLDKAKKLSPWRRLDSRKVFTFGKDHELYTPVGIQVVDYLQLYKKFSKDKRESHTLDHISFIELGEKKLDYSEYDSLQELYEKDYEKFIDYNIKDCFLIERLEHELGMLSQGLTLAYMAKINYSDIFGTIRPWDAISVNHLQQKNVVVPQAKERPRGEFDGGYVKEVAPGSYKWVVSVDFKSLYPHIIMGWNVSPDTLIGQLPAMTIDDLLAGGLEKHREFIMANNVSVAGNMCYYAKDRRGFLGDLMEKFFKQRDMYKTMMLAAKKEYEKSPTDELKNKIKQYDNMQQALKIVLNSLYGALSNQWFRFFDIRNAEAITTSGRLSIRWIEKAVNQYVNKLVGTTDVDYVIAMDTDSGYINLGPLITKLGYDDAKAEKIVNAIDQFCKKSLEPMIAKACQSLHVYTNSYEQRLHMKREVIAERAIWRKKKNYILKVWDSEGVRFSKPEIKMTGIEAVKTNTPQVCRDAIKQGLTILVDGTQEQLYQMIAEFKETFFELPPEDVATPSSVNGIEKYTDAAKIFRKGTSRHIKGALLYNHLISRYKLDGKYPKIFDEDKIKTIPLKMPNSLGYDVISFVNTLPPAFDLHKNVDYQAQFDKKFVAPLQTFVDIVGWQIEKKATLEDFFT